MGWNGKNRVLTDELIRKIEERIKKPIVIKDIIKAQIVKKKCKKVIFWKQKDIAWLKANYYDVPLNELWLKFPNRTKYQIRRKAYKLNLHRNPKSQIPWNKGLTKKNHPSLMKLSKTLIGKKLTTKHIKNLKISHKGYKMPQSQKDKISRSNKGKTIPLLQRLKMRKSKLGKNNPKYINGLCCRDLYGVIRDLKEYKEWRLMVFGRDNFTCQNCGKKGCYLEAHHKKPYVLIFEEFINLYPKLNLEKNTDKFIILAIKHDPFWDLNNGISFCRECHNLTKKKEIIRKIQSKPAN